MDELNSVKLDLHVYPTRSCSLIPISLAFDVLVYIKIVHSGFCLARHRFSNRVCLCACVPGHDRQNHFAFGEVGHW